MSRSTVDVDAIVRAVREGLARDDLEATRVRVAALEPRAVVARLAELASGRAILPDGSPEMHEAALALLTWAAFSPAARKVAPTASRTLRGLLDRGSRGRDALETALALARSAFLAATTVPQREEVRR